MFWTIAGLLFILGIVLTLVGMSAGNDAIGGLGILLVVAMFVLLAPKRIVQSFRR